MRLDLLADIGALAALLLLLVSLNRRHPEEPIGVWLGGLILIFGETVAHLFYLTPGPWHRTSHVVALNCFALAGMVFIWGAYRDIYSVRLRNLYGLANTPPLVLALTIYAVGVVNPLPFYILIAISLVTGICSILYLRLPTPFLVARVIVSLMMAWSVHIRDLRQAVYIGLFYLFLLVAYGFYRSLPARSIGKYAVVTGFITWSLIFLTHSRVSQHPVLGVFADELWNLQAFVVAIGMLLVLLERQISRNEHLALHDQLTGLPNRRLLDDRLCQAVLESERTGNRVALMILDLDGFKALNDSFGHETGDQFLCEVARVLRKSLRSYNTVARLGGDEFAILSPGLVPYAADARSAAVSICTNIQRALVEPITVGTVSRSIHCSIGFAIFPDDTREPARLFRLADSRMYEQKRAQNATFPAQAPAYTSDTAAPNPTRDPVNTAAGWPLQTTPPSAGD